MAKRSTSAVDTAESVAAEEPKRLAPGTDVSRELWLLSGNECAWPNCSVRLLNENDDWVGEIAHIRGAKEGSPRFDASMTNEERRAYDNLVILCPNHHEQVDGKNGRSIHSVAELERVKQQHEDRFRRVIAVLAESEQRYVDLTRNNIVKPCTTLARFMPGLDEEEAEWNVKVVNRLAGELSRVTLASRGLLSTVVEYEGKIGVAEAARRAETTKERVYELIIELDRFRLAFVEHEDEEIPERIELAAGMWNPIFEDWDVWESLREHVTERPDLTLDDIIVRLDFALLD